MANLDYLMVLLILKKGHNISPDQLLAIITAWTNAHSYAYTPTARLIGDQMAEVTWSFRWGPPGDVRNIFIGLEGLEDQFIITCNEGGDGHWYEGGDAYYGFDEVRLFPRYTKEDRDFFYFCLWALKRWFPVEITKVILLNLMASGFPDVDMYAGDVPTECIGMDIKYHQMKTVIEQDSVYWNLKVDGIYTCYARPPVCLSVSSENGYISSACPSFIKDWLSQYWSATDTGEFIPKRVELYYDTTCVCIHTKVGDWEDEFWVGFSWCNLMNKSFRDYMNGRPELMVYLLFHADNQ
eukprot:TRINITY_DN5208_c0_g1_i1.p1 TRINITY_DN5208_c0_g1~~TRINITY_DN5208_c0_g1_i1.p1  ORF type:complete len:295 (-),score=47.57 TRINITY_DN5208_c0_g1_i1:39-923(-)